MNKHPRTWFITGTSSGLGRSMTEQLLARGDRVAATLRNPLRLDDLKARYGESLWLATLDVTDTDAIRQTVERAFTELGNIDVVVSNAGYGLFGAGEEVTDDQIRHQLDTNLVGSIQLIRAVLPFLRAQGGGRIIQVSSEGGQIAYPNASLYHASKWGIEGFVESVAQEVAPFGIEFTLAEPGPTATNFGTSVVSPAPMAAYADTPAGQFRRAIAEGDFSDFGIFSDGDKVASAIVASADVSPAPRRQVYGSDPWKRVSAAYRERMAALEAQQAVAHATDADHHADNGAQGE